LTAARHDSLAYAKLASDPELHDSLAGFHAQQAIEKAIKAVLAHARIRFRRTHDIAELMDVLQDVGLAPPPFADRLDEFNPYAIEARYGLIEPQGLDRPATQTMILAVLDWANEQIPRA
jgi:HEPN domain-containing protein